MTARRPALVIELQGLTNCGSRPLRDRCPDRRVSQDLCEGWVEAKVERAVGGSSIGTAERLSDALADPVPHVRGITEVRDDKTFELAAGLGHRGDDDELANITQEIEAVVPSGGHQIPGRDTTPGVDHVIVAGTACPVAVSISWSESASA